MFSYYLLLLCSNSSKHITQLSCKGWPTYYINISYYTYGYIYPIFNLLWFAIFDEIVPLLPYIFNIHRIMQAAQQIIPTTTTTIEIITIINKNEFWAIFELYFVFYLFLLVGDYDVFYI